jgi:glucose-6-phosphate 1-epimerase
MSTQPDPLPVFPLEVQLKSLDGASARISSYGAHVLSWIPVRGDERLFLSSKTEFRPDAAIRGGVPVIFPRFGGTQFVGMGDLPKHGFARTQPWEVARANADSVVFWLSENETTRQLWPHRFLAEYTVRIGGNKLEMTLSIINTDTALLAFTVALHTYLRVDDVRKVAVGGLDGLVYRDSANGEKEARENTDRVTFPGEVDRIYFETPSTLELVDKKRTLSILSEGFPDAVIWNPGAEKCAKLADMKPDSYLQFVCIESVAVARPIQLAPGATWRGMQTLLA